jgi:hypothetical protein
MLWFHSRECYWFHSREWLILTVLVAMFKLCLWADAFFILADKPRCHGLPPWISVETLIKIPD